MNNTNLFDDNAIKKIKELAEDIDFTMMATQLGSKPFHAIPMSTKKVDDQGCIWFLSGKDSTHNAHIKADSNIMLIYSKPSDYSFMKVYADAEIVTDQSVLEDFYGKSDDMWFDGVQDPNLSAIKVTPIEAYYWEPKHNTFTTILKMGLSAITGDEPDISQHGKINP
ncbi:pyridoxamine 5'-phosphate oxidase family protein [Changchengzhania lutea]|uniref:pyridoxamine 5'-phosphate oxidase family protein n=1 Tax=Changchengzhania lutea TaxID=2049305 RepID=UPI00115DBCD5|nr:pyridoxamine 5'-phosphate oxidase family protein [Changchengzhania lutea]